MNEYKIIILRERPELAPIAAEWFHCKWGVPTEAYLECMEAYLSGNLCIRPSAWTVLCEGNGSSCRICEV